MLPESVNVCGAAAGVCASATAGAARTAAAVRIWKRRMEPPPKRVPEDSAAAALVQPAAPRVQPMARAVGRPIPEPAVRYEPSHATRQSLAGLGRRHRVLGARRAAL